MFQAQGHNGAVTSLCVEGDYLYSAGKDGCVKVWAWDGATNTLNNTVTQPTEGECHALLMYSVYLFAGVNGGVQVRSSPMGAKRHIALTRTVCA